MLPVPTRSAPEVPRLPSRPGTRPAPPAQRQITSGAARCNRAAATASAAVGKLRKLCKLGCGFPAAPRPPAHMPERSQCGETAGPHRAPSQLAAACERRPTGRPRPSPSSPPVQPPERRSRDWAPSWGSAWPCPLHRAWRGGCLAGAARDTAPCRRPRQAPRRPSGAAAVRCTHGSRFLCAVVRCLRC